MGGAIPWSQPVFYQALTTTTFDDDRLTLLQNPTDR
jgi:hypothetical protein